MQQRKFYGVGWAISALVSAVAFALPAQAQVGTLVLTDIGTPTTDTGNINTAFTFTIGDLATTSAETGIFAGLPTQDFGGVSFNDVFGTSFGFSSPGFGQFDSTSVATFANEPGSHWFYIEGNYVPGSNVSAPGPDPASLIISFTQTPAGSGPISDSVTFSIPPTGIPLPEPSTLSLLAVGAVGLMTRRGRK